MSRTDLHEGEAIEFKRRWTDQALEDLAAFANTRGGTLLVGFYSAGLIEQWGTGITRMLGWCREAGLPEPELQEEAGGFRVVFLKDQYTPERLRAMGLNERQIQIVTVLRSTQSASLGELHRLFQDISGKTIQRDLQALVMKGLLKAVGEKKGRRYAFAR